jgi:hypothetical protein
MRWCDGFTVAGNKRSEKIRVVDLDRRIKGPATPEEIANGIEYRDTAQSTNRPGGQNNGSLTRRRQFRQNSVCGEVQSQAEH